MSRKIGFLLGAVVLAAAFGRLAGQLEATADDPDAKTAGGVNRQHLAETHVAVLDVSRVLKQCDRFNDQLAELKREVAGLEEEVRVRQTEGTDLVNKLKDLKRGTPEYDEVEADIARKRADVQLFVAQTRKRMMQAEADLYAEVYTMLEQVVAEYARTNEIHLVLRGNPADEDAKTPQEVLRQVNRGIVHQSGLDITDDIVKAMNELVVARAG